MNMTFIPEDITDGIIVGGLSTFVWDMAQAWSWGLVDEVFFLLCG